MNDNDVMIMMRLLFLCCVFALFALSVRSQAGTDRAGGGVCSRDISVYVVHTNDAHSCIEPINPNSIDTAQADKGGFLRRIVLLDSLRSAHPEMLLFDCGDFSQGSPYYNIFKGEAEVELMNAMKYDACAIGNHEFDFGLDNMARVFGKADFPIVCCNYDFGKTVLSNLVKSYVVISRCGLKIGVLGVSPQLAGLVSKENYAGVGYKDPVESVNDVAEYLKLEEKCDLIVCLSHLGWGTQGVDDKMLIGSTRYVDVVLGGHTHTYFLQPESVANADGVPVYYSQMGKNARYVGWMNLTLGLVEE